MKRFTALLLAAVLGSCGGGVSSTITVFAASSLTDAFNALGAEFTKTNPQVTIKPSYAASSALVTQITQGAEADVFASADEPNMQKLIDAKLNDAAPKIFASNKLQIVVQAGNPKKIAELKDLTRADVVVVLAAPAVPVGAYAIQAFDKAGIKVTPKSLEADVKAVAAKVILGEADAGIIYSTDVKAGGTKIQGVDIPDQLNVIAKYPISVVKGSRNAKAAAAFIDFVTSSRGLEVLASFGFIKP